MCDRPRTQARRPLFKSGLWTPVQCRARGRFATRHNCTCRKRAATTQALGPAFTGRRSQTSSPPTGRESGKRDEAHRLVSDLLQSRLVARVVDTIAGPAARPSWRRATGTPSGSADRRRCGHVRHGLLAPTLRRQLEEAAELAGLDPDRGDCAAVAGTRCAGC